MTDYCNSRMSYSYSLWEVNSNSLIQLYFGPAMFQIFSINILFCLINIKMTRLIQNTSAMSHFLECLCIPSAPLWSFSTAVASTQQLLQFCMTAALIGCCPLVKKPQWIFSVLIPCSDTVLAWVNLAGQSQCLATVYL